MEELINLDVQMEELEQEPDVLKSQEIMEEPFIEVVQVEK